ncbi:hypothetical protein M433DRAFT_161107 [Acidomyces richmondensis BFW]|nr:hypothetical protein M433DRAFT_161107 [Acidomyces richmondensis BFW]
MAICKANGRISERLMNPMAIYHGIAVKVKENSSALPKLLGCHRTLWYLRRI